MAYPKHGLNMFGRRTPMTSAFSVQPSFSLAGKKDPVLSFGGGTGLSAMDQFVPNLIWWTM